MKKTLFSICVISLGVSLSTQAQLNHKWSNKTGGNTIDRATGNYTTSLGSNYVTGYFEGTVDLDPGVGVQTFTSKGSRDVFIQKFDRYGNLKWVRTMGGTLADEGVAVTASTGGKEIYVTGVFQGTADLNPTTGVQNFTSVGAKDLFITKLDSNGFFFWSKVVSGISDQVPSDIKTDNTASVLICGSFIGTTDFNPSTSINNISSTLNTSGISTKDGFVLKLTSSGGYIWAKPFAGQDEIAMSSIDLWNGSQFFLSGYFKGVMDANPSASTTNLNSAGKFDFCVIKMDGNGSLIWAKSTGGKEDDIATQIAVDIYGSVYATGYFGAFDWTAQTLFGVDFDPGTGTDIKYGNSRENLFVQKFTSGGTYEWTYMATTVNDWANKESGSANAKTFSPAMRGTGISIDICDDVYVTGYFEGRSDVEPGPGVTMISNNTGTFNGKKYGLVIKMRTTQLFRGAIAFGSATGHTLPSSIAADYYGTPYVAGYFNGLVDFDPSTTTANLTSSLNSAGTSFTDDAFAVKYGFPNAPKISNEITSIETNTSLASNLNLSMYPNPTKNILNIETPEQGLIEIFSITGQTIYNENVGAGIFSKDLTAAPSGVYIVKFTSENQSITQQVIKQD